VTLFTRQLTDGARVGIDPIIAIEKSKDLERIAAIREKTNRTDSSFKDDLILLYLIKDLTERPAGKREWARVLSAVGFTQDEIAEKMECNQKYISRLLTTIPAE
jgi:hypothetical protein